MTLDATHHHDPTEEAYELFHLYQTAPVGLALMDHDLRFVRINERLAEINGVPVSGHIGRTLREVIPDIAQQVEERYRAVLASGEPALDFEVRGTTLAEPEVERCWLVSYYPFRDPRGEIVGVSTVVLDITDRDRAERGLKSSTAALRQSQDRLRQLAGRLLSAQEEERSRLARDLHDDLTQRLAALAIEAGLLEKELVDNGAPAERIQGIQSELATLSTEVHKMSRRLHASIVEDLGLASALESECDGFRQRQGGVIEFCSDPVPSTLPPQTATGLFRIAQAALRNVAMHARAGHVGVSLTCRHDLVRLRVRDDGAGFDLNDRRRGGIGLSSMEERARLIGGTCVITTAPGAGTLIEVVASTLEYGPRVDTSWEEWEGKE